MYSAATAGYSWGSILFLLPHLLLGVCCVYFGMQSRNIMRTTDRISGLIFQWMLGLLFGGVAVFVLSKELVETIVCYRAETANEGELVSGRVALSKRFWKPGYGYVAFSVDGNNFRTEEHGPSCDCGFLVPLGKQVSIQPGRVGTPCPPKGGEVIRYAMKR
jgi:hypothetical protein